MATETFSLVLHGALDPSPEARDSLKTALSAVLQFNSAELDQKFSSLPTILQEQLPKDEAERLKRSIESFGGDVEIIPDVAPTTSSPDEFDLSLAPAEQPSEELAFEELKLAPEEEPVDLSKLAETGLEDQTPPDPTRIVHFEFEETESTTSETTNSALNPDHRTAFKIQSSETGDLTVSSVSSADSDGPKADYTAMHEVPAAVAGNSAQSFTETEPTSEERQETQEDGERSDVESFSADAETDWREVPLDWVPVSQQPKPEPKSKSIATATLCFGLLLGTLYLILAPVEKRGGLKIEVDVEQLLAMQQPSAEKRPNATPVRKLKKAVPFERYLKAESTLNSGNLEGAVKIIFGISPNGVEISEVLLSTIEPPLPTKKEYIEGKRAIPWIRRFEAKRPVSTRPKAVKVEGESMMQIRDRIRSRIVIEKSGRTQPTLGTFSIDAEYYPADNILRGSWQLSNLKSVNKLSESLAIRETDKGYEVAVRGSFEATLANPLALVSAPSAELTVTPHKRTP